MKCNKCGAEIDDDSRYCDQCGAHQPRKRFNVELWVAIAVVLSCTLIIGVLLNTCGDRIEPVEGVAELESDPVDEYAVRAVPVGYTDLGLPSGKFWKDENETNFYDYDAAVSKFGKCLPTKDDWEEVIDKCKWSWTGSGYKVTGPNGNSITLPAAGYRDCDGSVGGVGSDGLYWSSTPDGSDFAWYLDLVSGSVSVNSNGRYHVQSVRLVQD